MTAVGAWLIGHALADTYAAAAAQLLELTQ